MSIAINTNVLIDKIKHIDTQTYNNIQNCVRYVKLNNITLTFIGKGGEGIVYGIETYAIKFYKNNKSKYTNEFTNQGGSKEIFILKKSNDLVKDNITNTFVKIHGFTKIYGQTVVIMDLVSGDLENWTETKHSDNDWINMVFQLLYATFVMQNCLKIYHHDMKPKNLLFKKIQPSIFKYVIKTSEKNYEFVIPATFIFMISDFGQASTLLVEKNVHLPITIQLSIDNNLDLEHLAVFHNRQAVTLMQKAYKLSDLLDMGKNDVYFKAYYDQNKNKLEKTMRGYKQSVKDDMLFRALAYYMLEKKHVDINDIPNVKNDIYLPSKKIQKMLESLSELKGKGTLLNKIIELGELLNTNNTNVTKSFCMDFEKNEKNL